MTPRPRNWVILACLGLLMGAAGCEGEESRPAEVRDPVPSPSPRPVPVGQVDDGPTPLDASGMRVQFEVCVEQSADSAVGSTQIIRALRTAIETLSGTPSWRSEGYDMWPFDVITGCPGGFLAPPDPSLGRWSQTVGSGSPVPVQSSFTYMVYVTPASPMNGLGDGRFIRSAREIGCSGGTAANGRPQACGEVTGALFLADGDAVNADTLARVLGAVLGLDGP